MRPRAGALHYGVSCFEGMKAQEGSQLDGIARRVRTVPAVSVISKAFSCKDGKIRLLNPELNAKRMQKGAGALLSPGSSHVMS